MRSGRNRPNRTDAEFDVLHAVTDSVSECGSRSGYRCRRCRFGVGTPIASTDVAGESGTCGLSGGTERTAVRVITEGITSSSRTVAVSPGSVVIAAPGRTVTVTSGTVGTAAPGGTVAVTSLTVGIAASGGVGAVTSGIVGTAVPSGGTAHGIAVAPGRAARYGFLRNFVEKWRKSHNAITK